MPALKVLVLDSDPVRREATKVILGFLEYEVLTPSDSLGFEPYLSGDDRADMVLLGPCTADNNLLTAFHDIKARDDHMPVIALMDSALDRATARALDDGTIARLQLPLQHREFQQALQQVQIYRENRHLGGAPRSMELFRNLVGSSSGIRRVRRLIEQVAVTDASVLLLGESGTGKEVVARNIHYHSGRRYKPFVPVNCGAIPGELLESELFGHEKGAFTGAISARQGRFEMAQGGTLFLDEIGDMPLSMQVKLLRVLQEKTFERVGSNRSVSANVRIIAATHTDLESAIKAGDFREDLYYRLNVFPIEMPALRERVEDLQLLINDLISRMEHEERGSIRLTPSALQSLCRYPWPGNVRELANLIERLVILYPYGVVDLPDLPEKYQVDHDLRGVEADADLDLSGVIVSAQTLPREGIDLKEHLSRLEYMLIQQALDDAEGVVAHAAKRLGMGRTTLVEKMRKFNMQRREAGSMSGEGSLDEASTG